MRYAKDYVRHVEKYMYLKVDHVLNLCIRKYFILNLFKVSLLLLLVGWD
jgi:hypothetical protein